MRRSKQKPLTSPLTAEAARERQRFERVYQQYLSILLSTPLSVLVWGPNPRSSSPVAAKRVEIRDKLLERGHNAMFSEDLTSCLPAGQRSLPEKIKEFAQAQTAHVVIVLPEDAPGALAEVHDFCNHPDIAHKLCVLLPTRYKRGYSAQGAIRQLSDRFRNVHWYRPADLRRCNVLTVALEEVQIAQAMLVYSQSK